MKSSMQAYHQEILSHRSDEDELPKEWDYLSKRLTEVERGLTVINKKHHCLQKKFNIHALDVTKVQVELAEEVSQAKASQLNSNYVREIASDSISQLKKEILESNTAHFSRLESEVNLSLFEVKDSIDIKSKDTFEQARTYIDKTVSELKDMLQRYRAEGEAKGERMRTGQSSPCSVARLSGVGRECKSSKKCLGNTVNCFEKSVASEKESSNEALHSNSSTSRVNYLREKLKEFEKINRKYESGQGSSEKPEDIMEKMKGYRNYLEQSESELEPPSLFINQSEQSVCRKSFKR